MSPPRRRSARLRGATPKVCLHSVISLAFTATSDQDVQPARTTPNLDAVAEDHNDQSHETPARASLPPPKDDVAISSNAEPTTPSSSALKPSGNAMHPSKFHASVGRPSSASRLGFSDINPADSAIPGMPATLCDTPSRLRDVPQSEFTFRTNSQELSGPAYDSIMSEIKNSVAWYKAELVAEREAQRNVSMERKIATPKGRFSAAHAAEFKKMDSIENHASVWRASRTTPVQPQPEPKSSATKAKTDSVPSPAKSGLKRSHSKANLEGTPQSHMRTNLKRTLSRANLDGGEDSAHKNSSGTISQSQSNRPKVEEPSSSFAKRIKKYHHEDASAARPVSRDESSLPRPKSSGQASSTLTRPQSSSSLARLMSPTKSSIAHFANKNKSTISLVNPNPQSEVGLNQSTPLKKPLPGAGLVSPSKVSEFKRRILSPRGMQKVKSILTAPKGDTEGGRTAIPKPSLVSQTPGPQRTDKALPPLPLTTPRRKIRKQVSFTPDTKRAAEAQPTPSPRKTLMFGAGRAEEPADTAQYPSLDGILTESQTEPTSGEVVYPDLSGFRGLDDSVNVEKRNLPQSVPGTFTFRTDHTINFGATPSSGFGASPGQASLRQVRSSLAPRTNMPGSFPVPPSPSTHSNKENRAPVPSPKISGAPHGIPNKKRHRATSDEEDAEKESADRAAKKRKNGHVPEGQAVVAPNLVVTTPIKSSPKKQAMGALGRVLRTPRSAGTTPKKGGLSLDRLNMLARPKNRA